MARGEIVATLKPRSSRMKRTCSPAARPLLPRLTGTSSCSSTTTRLRAWFDLFTNY